MVAADAGPLIVLACAGRLELLSQAAGVVYLPPAVLEECIADPARPGARIVSAACDRGALLVRAPLKPLAHPPAALGAGEREALALALELSCPAMVDAKLARRAAASLGVEVFGSSAVLLVAKRRGLLNAVRPELERMRANGYHLSDEFIARVLAMAQEL